MAVTGSAAVLLLAAAVPTVLALTAEPHRTIKVVQPEPTRVIGAPPVCPKAFAGPTLWVPAPPSGVDGTSRLVPAQPPASAILCQYRLGVGAKGVLSGQRQLTGLADLAADLHWLPRKLPGQQHGCSAVGSTFVDNYLLGLHYPGGGTLWVSTQHEPNECVDTSNGRFKTQTYLGQQAANAYASGVWHNDGSGGGLGPDPCVGSSRGRAGQEKTLVPGTPVSVQVCQEPGPGTVAHPTWLITGGFGALVDSLDSAPTKESNWMASCPDAGPSQLYELIFHYSVGPDVKVRVQGGCTPGVDNDSLTTDDASAAIQAVKQLIAGRTPS